MYSEKPNYALTPERTLFSLILYCYRSSCLIDNIQKLWRSPCRRTRLWTTRL